jgi:DNA repair protein RadC
VFLAPGPKPPNDPRPSPSDIASTSRLAHVARELKVPPLAHFIITADELERVDCF